MTRIFRVATAVAMLAALAGCAPSATTSSRPVPIESRPTPPQPRPEGSTASPGTATTEPPHSDSAHKPEPVTEAGIAADTLQTHATLERCAQRKLLPDQESTVDAVREALGSVQVELVRGDLTRAASFARQARQLASSLSCP